MKPLRVLLTNHNLGQLGGTELYIRDVAIGLQAIGHTPFVFSMNQGIVADQLRRASIVVLDDLSHLPQPPDIIHAQHSLEAAVALLAMAMSVPWASAGFAPAPA